MTQVVTTAKAGAVTTIWLDREAKRNALDGALMRELAAALDAAAVDAEARVVVIRGRGPVFSSGIDHGFLMELMVKSRTVPFAQLVHDVQDVFTRAVRMAKPVIACAHGACVGMALELALAADFRLATKDCVFGLPEIAFGIVPDVGGTTRLLRVVGPVRAKELILTGKIVGAATAARLGLVNEVADDAADLDRRVTALATTLAAHAPTAVGLAKQLCAISADADAATSLRLEGIVQQTLIAQPDLAERFPRALAFIKERMAHPE